MVKPGIQTTEFVVSSGTIASILGGVVSSAHSQIILAVVAGVYTFARTVAKAVDSWQSKGP
jgi:hypothetical protein